MVFNNLCTTEGRVLNACTREVRFFGEHCVLERVRFFKDITSDEEGIFANFQKLCQFTLKTLMDNVCFQLYYKEFTFLGFLY